MKKTIKKWRSPSLGKDMRIAIYGESGTPILGFPTRGQDCEQWEKYGMTDAIEVQIKEGFNQLFCVDSVDDESFLNERLEGHQRLMRHGQYEAYIREEVLPFIHKTNNIEYIIAAGVDLGGYHAVNLALKHPGQFGKAVGISGIYDIKRFMDGYYSDNVYYNNPTDYMPNLNKQDLLEKIRDTEFRLVSYLSDQRKEEAEQFSNILRMKFIDHQLDVWDLEGDDEWQLWTQMLKTHII